MPTLTQAIPDDVLSDMNFDVTLRTVKVTVGDERMVMAEASESAVIAYRNAARRNMTISDSGNHKMEITDIRSPESILLSRCLYYAAPDGNIPMLGGVPNSLSLVSVEKIRAWQQRITDPLVERLKKMSDLDQDETEEQLINTRAKIDMKLEKLQKSKETLKNE